MPRDAAPSRVAELLDEALELPADQRAAFLQKASNGDASLVREVESLLSALTTAGEFLTPAHSAATPPDPLAGVAIGPYRIAEKLGEGGMGVVYRAMDERLGRSVAIKVLPGTGSLDPGMRSRLDREARALASLNHPNIAAIYGIEDSPLTTGPVLVLELVHGETLAAKLDRTRLTLDESIAIACQIARALEAAHGAGIIHRDLKPANVVIADDGRVKVLDFGLAKIADGRVQEEPPPPAEQSPTASRVSGSQTHAPLVTQNGMVIGTAAYMSPEQARGKFTDRRADLWAFGCVLFEMLAGRRAFPGSTAGEVIDAVVKGSVDWRSLPETTPPGVRRVLDRCLRVNTDTRMRDAGDARVELEEAMIAPAPAPRRARWRGMWGAAVLALTAGLFAFGIARWSGSRQPLSPLSSSLVLPPGKFVTPVVSQPICFTPDGNSLYLEASPRRGNGTVHRRVLNSFEFEDLGIEGGNVATAPTGDRIACWARLGGADLLVVLDGKTQKVLAKGPETSPWYGGHTWVDDDSVVTCGQHGELTIWNATTGAISPLPSASGGAFAQPTPVPGQRAILATSYIRQASGRRLSIVALPLSNGEQVEVMPNANAARMLGNDILIFYRDAALWAVKFNPATLHAVGAPLRVLEGLPPATDTIPFVTYDVSSRGALAYIPGTATYEATSIAWVNDRGDATFIANFSKAIWSLRLSRDGKYVAVNTREYGEDGELRVVDLSTGRDVIVAKTLETIGLPVWTPDDAWIVYNSGVPDSSTYHIWRVRPDGSAEPELLRTMPDGVWCDPTDVTPDGKDIIAAVFTGKGNETDLFYVPMDATQPLRKVLATTADRTNGRISPDGTLLAWAGSAEASARTEVFIQPYPALDRMVRVSQDGGFRLSWAAQGRRLAYRWGDSLHVVDIGMDLSVGRPIISLQDLPDSRFDAAPDGVSFLMAVPAGGSKPANMIQLEEGFEQRVRAALRDANEK